MKKILEFRDWIIGFIGCVIFVSFMAYQQHWATEKYKKHRAEYCSALTPTAEQKKACVEERTSARDYLPWGYELFSWPEGITTWAIILTGFAIAWQSSETRKAAQATVASVKAIDRQATAMENAERARISVEGSRLGNFSFQFTAKNIGRTSAKITYARGFSAFVNRGESLPDIPIYLSGEPIGFEPVQWIGPGDDLELVLQENDGHCHPLLIADLNESSMRNNIQLHGHSLWIYGRVLYFDGISNTERDFRFCYGFRVDRQDGTLYYSGGPEAYRQDC